MVGWRQNSTISIHKTIGNPRQREAARLVSTVQKKIMSCRSKEPLKKVPQLYEDANVPEFTDLVLQRVTESMSMVYGDDSLMTEGHEEDIPDYATKLGLHLVLPTLPAFPRPNNRRLANGDVREESVRHLLVGCLMLYDIYDRFWGYRVIEGTSHLVFRVDMLRFRVLERETNRSWNGIGWTISNDLRIATKNPLIHRDVLLQCLEAALVMSCGIGSIDNLCCARLFVYLYIHHKCELSDEDWNSLDKKFFYAGDLSEQVLLAKTFVEKFANDQSIEELSEEMEKLTA